MGLLLGGRHFGIASSRRLETLGGEGRSLWRCAIVIPADEAILLLALHCEIRFRSSALCIAGGPSAVSSDVLAGLLLVAPLLCFDLLLRSLLLLCAFFLIESAAGFGDGLCARAGVDIAATADAEAFVCGSADGGARRHGVGR